MSIDKTLYDRLGGKATLERVHKTFYDMAFAHPWLRKYFTDKPQLALEEQQTDFMSYLIGGPNRYTGKTPKMAHQHMVITEELFEVRRQLLSDAIKKEKISDKLREEWLAADSTLKRALVKKSAADCQRAYANQEILDFKNPAQR